MIHIKGLSFTYPESVNPALHDISLELHEGEVVLLAGPNGGGKSTLLKAILGIVPQVTGGTISGHVMIGEKSVRQLRTSELAGKIGIVLQDPESQVSNLTVGDEVRFGPANLCWPKVEVYKQAAQALHKLGIAELEPVSVLALSGGQLQRLSLAALLAMKPEVLILDEPVTNLDPLGVDMVITALRAIKSQVKLMIISSHWLDPFLDLATRLIVFEHGRVALDDTPVRLASQPELLGEFGVQVPQVFLLRQKLAKSGLALPADQTLPTSFNEWEICPTEFSASTHVQSIVDIENVSYRYPKLRGGSQPLSDIDLTLFQGEHVALVGHNGTGKSTLARLIASLLKPTTGRIIRHDLNRIGLMLQKPTLGFLEPTVRQELAFGLPKNAETKARVEKYLHLFELSPYADQLPFHLSGGEQRRLSLATAMIAQPELLILDEPTAGLDSLQVGTFLQLLKSFVGTVVHITHDTRIVGAEVDRAIVLGGGQVAFAGHPALMTDELLKALGYDLVNTTIEFCMGHLKQGFPMLPSQLEVRHVGL
jgi:energy-coupling factor transporter ATP-binding protein EcfA2